LFQVEEGELVYYPNGYWHQTENLGEENIAASGTVIDANNFRAVQREMEIECRTKAGAQRFAFNPDICRSLDTRLFPWWQTAFVGDFDVSPPICDAGVHHPGNSP
jgi:oxalate decarboxylase/phosphoglucose isomerase-like protein (cupin superfamily)